MEIKKMIKMKRKQREKNKKRKIRKKLLYTPVQYVA